MRYYLDTEFDGFRGKLLSMALVREDGRSLYFVLPHVDAECDPWVQEHVLPILRDSPEPPQWVSVEQAPFLVQNFLDGDGDVILIADCPDDHRHFCDLVVYGPGQMISLPKLTMIVERVDAYPSVLTEAVQHVAWWDAVCLREKLNVE